MNTAVLKLPGQRERAWDHNYKEFYVLCPDNGGTLLYYQTFPVILFYSN